jgi:branched-chain amino acid transport system ATP-binding protein
VTFRLEGVHAGYGATTVLRGVDLTIPDSGIVALLGPNGAGKTTLLRVASGLLKPSRGRLLIDGKDVTGASPHQLKALGVCHIPEGRGVFPTLTVRENLVLYGAPGKADDAVERAVSAFPRLGERIGQVAGTMSGGEQQMLALSRAYVQAPRVILLDEISMGLAPTIVDEIFIFLERLAREGASLLLVEQYVARALELAQDVCLLNRGSVAFRGEPSELADTDIFASYVGA